MKAFTIGEENWLDNVELMPAIINSRITFIPAKNKMMDIVNPLKIPLKCLCQPDVALVEDNLQDELTYNCSMNTKYML